MFAAYVKIIFQRIYLSNAFFLRLFSTRYPIAPTIGRRGENGRKKITSVKFSFSRTENYIRKTFFQITDSVQYTNDVPYFNRILVFVCTESGYTYVIR